MGRLINREELYNLVWSKPITKIAKDYRVSDSAIIKICKKMEIPRPERGYWTKVECGKKVRTKPLPRLSQKGVGHHYLWRQGHTEGRSDEKGELHPQIVLEGTAGRQIVVPETMDAPHRLTGINLKRFNNAKADDRGILQPRASQHFDLAVTQKSVDRALRIMDSLLKAFEIRGWAFEMQAEPKLAMGMKVLDENIRFSMEETVNAVEHVLTEKEKRQQARGHWVWHPRYDYIPSGKLKLRIHTFYSYSGRSSWGDGKVQRVEGCLNKFCAGLVQYAHASNLKRVDDERERRKHKRESEARERTRSRNAFYLERRKQLLNEVGSWRMAEEIRAYVAASRELAPPEEFLQECHSTWSQWALAYADSIDPLAGGSPLEREDRQGARRLGYR
jgi:uncharacterized protein YutD